MTDIWTYSTTYRISAIRLVVEPRLDVVASKIKKEAAREFMLTFLWPVTEADIAKGLRPRQWHHDRLTQEIHYKLEITIDPADIARNILKQLANAERFAQIDFGYFQMGDLFVPYMTHPDIPPNTFGFLKPNYFDKKNPWQP